MVRYYNTLNKDPHGRLILDFRFEKLNACHAVGVGFEKWNFEPACHAYGR